MNALKEQISLLRSFLRSDFRKIVLCCTAGFVVAAFIGCIVGHFNQEIVVNILTSFEQSASESGIIKPDGSFSPLAFLAHNWSAMLTAACYGFIPFLFLPAISLFTNGFILGILAAVYMMSGTSLLIYFAGLLPHGIFELPAIILSIACGIYLCICLNKLIMRSFSRTPLPEVLCNILRVMLLLVAPMTAAAAFIEAYITPLVITLFM